ncbi:MAG TPA: hypothetical protein VMV95_03495 [Bacillota bacterium]|nr:hypothetical protein [Bacillota bacterium]
MDPGLYAKIECAKKALIMSGLKDNYDCYVDEKTGAVIVKGKKEIERSSILDRFELMEL